MKSHWEAEKEAIAAIRQTKARIEEVRGEAERRRARLHQGGSSAFAANRGTEGARCTGTYRS
jgi:hypothetical protein